jgi:hypothetical protein
VILSAEYNPFSAELAAVTEKIKANAVLESDTENALAWYAKFDLDGTRANLNVLQSMLRQTDGALEKLTPEFNKQQFTVSVLERKTRMGFNPRYWLSTERRIAIREHEQASDLLAPLQREYTNLRDKKKNIDQEAHDLQEELTRYRSFDVLQAEDMVRFLHQEKFTLDEKIIELTEREREAESKLRPSWEQLQELLREEETLNEQINDASQLADELSDAANGYERKQIHERCDAMFNDGNPDRVRDRFERQLKSVERSIEKTKDNLERDKQRLTLDIYTVVIDGSNLLYKRGDENKNQFIGLVALDSLIPVLARKVAKVILFFDAGAPSRLRMTEQALCDRFSRWAKEIIVIPVNSPADETILAVAAKNPRTYVISQDRYRDYVAQNPWIKDRQFVPIIVDDVLHLHDMFIEVPLTPNS